jgi:hypothetical protein
MSKKSIRLIHNVKLKNGLAIGAIPFMSRENGIAKIGQTRRTGESQIASKYVSRNLKKVNSNGLGPDHQCSSIDSTLAMR